MQNNYTKFPNRIIENPSLSVNAKVVLLCILKFNPSYPSRNKISFMTGLSLSTVRRAILELKEKRIISWKSGKKLKKTNQYILLDEKYWKLKKMFTREPLIITNENPLDFRNYTKQEIEHLLTLEPEEIPFYEELHQAWLNDDSN